MSESRKLVNIRVFTPVKLKTTVHQFSPVYTLKPFMVHFSIILSIMVTSLPSCFKSIQLKILKQGEAGLNH